MRERLNFVFDALVRINDRQEQHSDDTAEDLTDIQRVIESVCADLDDAETVVEPV